MIGQIAYFVLRLLLVDDDLRRGHRRCSARRESPAIVLTIPAAILTGLAFATPIAAFSTTLKDGAEFNLLFRFGITPLFLFSGTFFPIEQLPPVLQPIAWLTPLYHGVALTRGLALGTLDPIAGAIHVGYLVALAVVGAILFDRLLRRRLAR